MNKNKQIWILIVLVLIAAAMASQAFALGIRPAKITVEFQPGLTKSYSFTVVNDDDKQNDVLIYAEGELKNYVRVHSTASVIPANGTLDVAYSVEFPSDAELPPGDNLVKIFVEHTDLVNQGGNSLATKIKLAYKLTISAPYPSKFVEASFDVTADAENIKMQTIVDNKGSENIASVKPTYHIKEGTTDIFTATSDSKALSTGQKGVFETFVKKTALPIGLYQALAIVNYDDKIVELSKDFKLGEEKISLVSYDKFIKFNEINSFNIDVKNEWNKIIQNIYAELKVSVGNNTINMRTESFSMMPRETKKITTYFDARNIDAGAYGAELAVYYANKTEQAKFKLEIVLPEEYNTKLAAAAAVAEMPVETTNGGILSSSGVIIALIVANILIIGAIAYLLYRKPLKIVSTFSDTIFTKQTQNSTKQSQENASSKAVAELDLYINRLLAQKMPKRELKQKLVAAGWPNWFIDEKLDKF